MNRISCLVALPLCLLLAGCSTPNRATTGDPLLGGPALRPSAQGPQQSTTPLAVLPPVTAPNSALSTAALAGSGSRQFDRDRDLRIADPRSNPANDGWAGQAAGPRGEGAGAVLRAPEAVADPASQRSAVPASPPNTSAANRFVDFDQAQAQLRARGVLWQRLETNNENGTWRFVCSVPNRQNPNKHRTYEATRPDYMSAVQAVLEEMDRSP